MTRDTDNVPSGAAPLVSVSMTAFHSDAWLPRAIDSVLQQKTSFPLEIVVGDDCSTDTTAEILRGYQERYPTTIRVLERTEKLGMQRNFYDTFEHCRGKYIAWLDADDYWTDPRKLDMQVVVMETDTSISACGHFVRQVSSTGQVTAGRCPTLDPGRYRLADIIKSNFVPSPSIVFRNGIHRSLPERFFQLTGLVDWPILLQSALAGDIVLLDGVMADYVLTPGSAYQSKGPLYQDSIDLEFYEMMGPTLPQQWQRAILTARGKRYEAISHCLLQEGRLAEARTAAYQALRLPHMADNLFSKIKALALAELRGRWRPGKRLSQS